MKKFLKKLIDAFIEIRLEAAKARTANSQVFWY
jgi:hypothetical protein